MRIFIDDNNKWLKDNMERIIKDVITQVLSEENFSQDVEISITLTDNKTIKEINHNYRNINKATDVLSFPQVDWENNFATNPNLAGENLMLGDIIISVDMLISQAKEYNHSLERELGFLIAHSMFHLLGYDHANRDDEKIMIRKQETVLERLGLVR